MSPYDPDNIDIYDYDVEHTCFSEGNSGNCGVTCRVFECGDCENVSELGLESVEEIIEAHGLEDAVDIMLLYSVFKKYVQHNHPEYMI